MTSTFICNPVKATGDENMMDCRLFLQSTLLGRPVGVALNIFLSKGTFLLCYVSLLHIDQSLSVGFLNIYIYILVI